MNKMKHLSTIFYTASLLAMMFAEGMNQVENLRDTIYWN